MGYFNAALDGHCLSARGPNGRQRVQHVASTQLVDRQRTVDEPRQGELDLFAMDGRCSSELGIHIDLHIRYQSMNLAVSYV